MADADGWRGITMQIYIYSESTDFVLTRRFSLTSC